MLQTAEQKKTVRAAYIEQSVAQDKRMAFKRAQPIGVAVEQQVVIQQQGLKLIRGLQNAPEGNCRLNFKR